VIGGGTQGSTHHRQAADEMRQGEFKLAD